MGRTRKGGTLVGAAGTLAEYGAQTKLTLHQAVFETVTACDLDQGGWKSAFQCLADFLAQD